MLRLQMRRRFECNRIGQRPKAMTDSHEQLIPFNKPNGWVPADANAARGSRQDDSPLLQRAALQFCSTSFY